MSQHYHANAPGVMLPMHTNSNKRFSLCLYRVVCMDIRTLFFFLNWMNCQTEVFAYMQHVCLRARVRVSILLRYIALVIVRTDFSVCKEVVVGRRAARVVFLCDDTIYCYEVNFVVFIVTSVFYSFAFKHSSVQHFFVVACTVNTSRWNWRKTVVKLV